MVESKVASLMDALNLNMTSLHGPLLFAATTPEDSVIALYGADRLRSAGPTINAPRMPAVFSQHSHSSLSIYYLFSQKNHPT